MLVRPVSLPDEVVSRRDLEYSVWPNMIVNDDAVTGAIVKLRRAFCDSTGEPT